MDVQIILKCLEGSKELVSAVMQELGKKSGSDSGG
jgi:hypothetical protein